METRMDRITTRMMEHICDNLCKYPDQLSGEELEEKCTGCKMGKICMRHLKPPQQMQRDLRGVYRLQMAAVKWRYLQRR